MIQIDITDRSLKNILLMYRNIICDKKLHSDNRVPKSPNNATMLSKCYEKELLWADKKMDSFEKEFCLENVCQKGCSMCCKQSVYISLVEALVIKNKINNMDYDDKQLLKEKVDNVCNILNKNGLSNISIDKLVEDDDRIKEKYFSLSIRCPLLSENNTCLIHAVRPLSCCLYRAYGSSMDCLVGYDVQTTISYQEIGSFIQNRLCKAVDLKGWYKQLPIAMQEIFANKI